MEIKNIDPQTLKIMLENDRSVLLIDCREKDEWQSGHIAKAHHLALSQLPDSYSKELTNKQQPIILQCRSGQRSLRAAQFLVSQGYQNIYNLEGGIMNWSKNQFLIVTDDDKN